MVALPAKTHSMTAAPAGVRSATAQLFSNNLSSTTAVPITVLLIAGKSSNAQLVQDTLLTYGSAYKVLHTASIKQATDLLKSMHTITIILSDITLPDAHGVTTFQLLKKVAAELPVVFFTSGDDEGLAASALQKGAEDYLLKGQFDSATLERSMHYAIERKKFQNEMQVAKDKARTLRLKAKALKEKSAQLQELNDVKDDFILLASHQLRTPATGVKQYISMLRENYFGKLNAQQKHMLDIAHESNERQLRIVDDLLKVANADSSQFQLHKQEADIVALLKHVIGNQLEKFNAKHQQITLKSYRNKVVLAVDTAQMRMVFESLIDNANRYTPEGKNVYVRIYQKDGRTAIDVKDEGVGIHKKDLSKLFQKFTRITNPLSLVVGGSGLGLYWVKRIITMHGGSVRVWSALGKGSIFTVII